MRSIEGRLSGLLVWLACALPAAPALAARCQDPAGFETWIENVKQEAAGQGISNRAIAAGLAGVIYDPAVISHDRRQGVFRQTFEQFSARMVSAYRLQRGAVLIKRHDATFVRIERQFGVPAPV